MAAFKKIIDAIKQAVAGIQAKPGLPAIKQGFSDIGKSIDVNAIKNEIQTPIKKTIDDLMSKVKAKGGSPSSGAAAGSPVDQIKKSAEDIVSAIKAKIPAPPSGGGGGSGGSPIDSVKKPVMDLVNTIKAKVDELTKKGGKPPIDLEGLKKSLDVDKLKKAAQEVAAKAQASVPKKK